MVRASERHSSTCSRLAVINETDGLKLQVDVVNLDLTALIDTRQLVD